MPIPKIKPLHLSREWNRLLTSGGRGRKAGKPLSRKTVRNIAGLVSSAYTRGLRWGIAEVNPVPASEPPVPKKKEGIALSVEQAEQLIAGATAPWGMDVFLELDAATGARRGELLGLQWSDLDGNHLMIGRSLSQVGQEVFLKEPKNKKFRSHHDPAVGPEEAAGAPQDAGTVPRAFRRQLSGRFHLLQSGRLAAEAGHGLRLRLAAVPQSRNCPRAPAFTRCATPTARTCWPPACR